MFKTIIFIELELKVNIYNWGWGIIKYLFENIHVY